jgi:uncharacterized protein (DUF342 family)
VSLDDETMKQIGTGTASTAAAGLLGFLALWFTRMTSLPRRVDRLERRAEASDRLLLALADTTLARAPKDKAEARDSLREARESMYNTLTKAQGSKQ